MNNKIYFLNVKYKIYILSYLECIKNIFIQNWLMWKTRAKQNWLREGDRNTKFFHAFANGRRRNNEIGTVVDDGRSYHSEEEKRSYFYRKFKALFSPEDTGPADFGDWSDLFRSRRLTDADRVSLTAPFSSEEIRIEVFQLGGQSTGT